MTSDDLNIYRNVIKTIKHCQDAYDTELELIGKRFIQLIKEALEPYKNDREVKNSYSWVYDFDIIDINIEDDIYIYFYRDYGEGETSVLKWIQMTSELLTEEGTKEYINRTLIRIIEGIEKKRSEMNTKKEREEREKPEKERLRLLLEYDSMKNRLKELETLIGSK